MTYGYQSYEEEKRAALESEAFGSRLWDADPTVCCAAFQLGACEHTEAPEEWTDEDEAAYLAHWDEDALADWQSDQPAWVELDEPF